MIRLQKINFETYKMKIEMHLPQSEIFSYLQKKGYEINSWIWRYEDEIFPGGITHHEQWTFTATKPGEIQCEEAIFTSVFEREMKQYLNELA